MKIAGKPTSHRYQIVFPLGGEKIERRGERQLVSFTSASIFDMQGTRLRERIYYGLDLPYSITSFEMARRLGHVVFGERRSEVVGHRQGQVEVLQYNRTSSGAPPSNTHANLSTAILEEEKRKKRVRLQV